MGPVPADGSLLSRKRVDPTYVFKYLLLANFLQYLEAGAVPALLLTLSQSFSMTAGQEGVLGGVVYLSLGLGGPFAAFLLKTFDHKRVVVCGGVANMLCTVLWAMTPIGNAYSTEIFIVMRFMMGLCQCIVCVFLPLWTNENAPRQHRTTWMSYLQASVPFGVMMGYIIASICLSMAERSMTCCHLLCWRWPFLIEVLLLCPVWICLYLIPDHHLSIRIGKLSAQTSKHLSLQNFPSRSPTPIKVKPSLAPISTTAVEGAGNGVVSNENMKRPTAANKNDSPIGLLKQAVSNSNQELKTVQSAGEWMSSISREDIEEKKHRMSWRRNSMNASLFDPLAARDMIKRSYDNFAVLDGGDGGVFGAMGGFRWSDASDSSTVDYAVGNDCDPMADEKTMDAFGDQKQMTGPNASVSSNVGGYGTLALDKRNEKRGYRNSLPLTSTGLRVACTEEEPLLQYESLKEARRRSLAQELNFMPISGRKRTSSASSTCTNNGGATSPERLSQHLLPLVYSSNSPMHLLKSSRKFSREDLGVSGELSLTAASVDSDPINTHECIDEEVKESNDLECAARGFKQSLIARAADSSLSDEFGSGSGSESGDDWCEASPVSRPIHRHSFTESTNARDSRQSTLHRSWLRPIFRLLQIPVYRSLLGAMTALYFTVTGVQYWGTKYLSISLKAPLPLVHSLFVLCAATGPTFGVFFGGWLIDLSGGYKGSKQRLRALEICAALGLLASVFSLPITFFSDIFAVVGWLWLLLFFGASILPACSGILVSIVPRHYRPASSSLSLVVFNMLGYCLSLILSGFLMEWLEAKGATCDEVCAMTWGFRLVLFGSFFGAIFLLCALYASYRSCQEKERRRGRVFQSPQA